MADNTSQTSLASLEDATAKAKAAANAASADARVYETAYRDIDKELARYGIPQGQFGQTNTPGSVRELQLKSIQNIAQTNPALAEQLRVKVEERAKNALVYEEKQTVANKAYKESDKLEEELDTQRGVTDTGAATSPPPAKATPGNPTDYTPAPSPPTPNTTTDTQTTPAINNNQYREANNKIYAEKGDPVTQKQDPNDPDVTVLMFSDGTTARRRGRRGEVVLDAPAPPEPLNAAAQEKVDLAKRKREEAAQLGEQKAQQRAQVDQNSKELDAAIATGDPQKIAMAEAKYDASKVEYRKTLNTETDLKSEASLAERQSIYLNSIKDKQELANQNGGGQVAPTPTDPVGTITSASPSQGDLNYSSITIDSSSNPSSSGASFSAAATNNVKTAAEWETVIDTLETVKKSTLTQANELREQLTTLQSRRTELSAQLTKAQQGDDPEYVAAIRARISEVDRKIEGNKVVTNNVMKEISEYDQDLKNAYLQKATAESGPPNLLSTTPPANAEPGDSTDVAAPVLEPLPTSQQEVDESGVSTSTVGAEEVAREQQIIAAGGAINQAINAEEVAREQQIITAGAVGSQAEADAINQAITENGEKVLVGPVVIEKPIPNPIGTGSFIVRSSLDVETGKITISILDEKGIKSQLSKDGNPDNIIKEIEKQLPLFPPPSQYGAVLQKVLAAVKESKAELTQTYEANKTKAASAKSTTPTAVNAAIAKKTERGVFEPPKDWRVRISLAPKADYLYKSQNPGILAPLLTTGGVLFPYMPSISVSYSAQYDSQDLTHSNYKIHNYRGSSVDQVQISGDFTAQDSTEANYILAVIHFFRSATKMFYGQDQNPSRGTPPPLVYLSGHGQYQFDNHPMVIQSFNYSLPVDVDYINAYPSGSNGATGGVNLAPYKKPVVTSSTPLGRLTAAKLKPGGIAPAPVFTNAKNINEITRVPTKITVAITCLPIVTRNAVSNYFSLAKYATGELLQGSKNSTNGGGFW